MPTTTTNLGLPLYNNTTDSQAKFLTYRTDVNGATNSAFTKVDSWAGTVNKKLADLADVTPNIMVNATWISMGYYEATVPKITEYKVDTIITFRPNIDTDGTTTLKINSLPIKSLMKYDEVGGLKNLDVRDLRKNHEYTFRYDGTNWVWQGGSSADQTNIVGDADNLIMVDGNNNLKDSGIDKADVSNVIASTGDVANLKTTDKSTLVSAVNENVDKIALLNTNKVDKVNGKQLSTEDYTTTEKNKVATIDSRLTKTDLVAGANITLSKNEIDNTVVISSTGGGAGGTGGFVVSSGLWKRYTATTKVNFFIVEGYGLNKTIEVVHQNLQLIDNVDFTITNEGLLTLMFTLEIGESVDYRVSDVTLDYSKLLGSPVIANNLTTTASGGVLDARQGKVLDERITVLSTDRGYKDTKDVSNTNLNNLLENGIYKGFNLINAPNTGWFFVQVIKHADVYVSQTLTAFATGGLGIQYTRVNDGGTWQPWKQLATTEKVPFSVTARAGYTILEQKCNKINNVVYFYIHASKNSGNFQQGVIETIATIPSGMYDATSVNTNSCYGYGSSTIDTGTATFSSDSALSVIMNGSNSNKVRFSGVVLL